MSAKEWPDDPWWEFLPDVHAALPAHAPARRITATKKKQCGYFFSLYYLLAIHLGWTDVAKGLLALGLPSDLHPIGARPGSLLSKLWTPQASAALAGWAWFSAEGHMLKGVKRPPLGRDVEAALRKAMAETSMSEEAGYDPLHLSFHMMALKDLASGDGTGTDDESERNVSVDDKTHVVGITTSSLAGALRVLGEFMVDPGTTPEWRLRIASADVGWVGEFRQCHECFRGYQGELWVHALGHATMLGKDQE